MLQVIFKMAGQEIAVTVMAQVPRVGDLVVIDDLPGDQPNKYIVEQVTWVLSVRVPNKRVIVALAWL